MIGYQQKENVAMAFQTLMAHKFRSFLTILGIIIGVLTVVVIASILAGMRESIISIVQEFGTDNIFAFHLGMGPRVGGRRPTAEMQRKPLSVADASAIKEQCPSVNDVSWQGFSFHTAMTVKYQNNIARNFSFNGVPANYASVANVEVTSGRFFSEPEDAHGMDVVVLGPDVKDALFPHSEPLGKRILINGHPFTVLGITAKSKAGAMGDNSRDSAVLIPYRSFLKMMPWENWHLLLIQARQGKLNVALDEVESLLRRRRGVKPKEPNNFDLSTADMLIQQFDAITASVGLIAIAISSIGLLVGGIGVMNIMLVSVTERTREIGVRKAVGATHRDIILQFLVEAMTLTGVGGVFGVILAIGASYLVMAFVPSLPASVPLWAVITGLVVSVTIGLVFGVWPARKAAYLDPIEALRYE
ncbi:MAG: ABC transporter permease [Acidobacteriota bacterium]|jgi:putative ABC transport system permease protein